MDIMTKIFLTFLYLVVAAQFVHDFPGSSNMELRDTAAEIRNKALVGIFVVGLIEIWRY